MFTGEIQAIDGLLTDVQTAADVLLKGPKFSIGRRIATDDGRVFRWALAGAVDLVVGNVIQAAAPVPNHLALTPSAAAIGATQVLATLGATAATANQYAGGYLQVDTTPGNGQNFLITGHAAVLSGGVITVNLSPQTPVVVALTGSSRVGLIANPYSGVIQVPTTKTALVVGVAISIVPAGGCGWIQTWGSACALCDATTPAITAPVVNSAATAGAYGKWTTAAADVAVQPIGHTMQVGVSGKNNQIFLQIAP